ncbi:MAG: hypothetical protein IJU28_02425, partial [Clostridia bacterium]|nr:hypothetical protein [Clostridia bacterium]
MRTAPARLGSAQPARPQTKKNGASALSRVFSALRKAGLFIAGAAVGFYHLFDRFRTSEGKRIVTNTILIGVLILLLASVFMLLKPSIDASSAVRQAKKGDAAEAMQLLNRAEAEGLGDSRLDKARIQMADAFTSQGRYTLARQLTEEVSDAAKAAQQNSKTDYAEAVSLYGERNFQGAAQLFYRLGTYRDSAEKYRDCLCATAVTAYLEGSEARARSLLAELSDAESRLGRVCAELGHRELLNDPLFSAESLKHMRESYAQLRQSRQASPKGLIAAGARHSLVLRSSGGVLAQGDNSQGQCNTGAWSNITMVAAGNSHSVGLRADGTVVACGDNSEGQCDVGSWSDITAVSAGAYVTVGLKRDGTVVWCGRGSNSLDSWQNVQLLTAGGYAVGALNENGTMLCSHTSALLPMDVKMFELSVCSAVSAGILYDGSLITTLKNAPDWQELKSVAVSETGIYGLTLSGAV